MGSATSTPTYQALEANIKNAGGVSIATRPTVTILSTASATGAYSPPTGTQWLKIRMVGGGGGGSGSGTGATSGSAGTDSTLGTLTAIKGGAGLNNASAGAGGGATNFDFGIQGGGGLAGQPAASWPGGDGGVSFFGGAGRGGSMSTSTTPTAGTNATGRGSGGGAGGMGSSGGSAGSGGAAGYGEKIITSISAPYTYGVGAGGAGGNAGTGGAAGGAGADGIIIIEEYYS